MDEVVMYIVIGFLGLICLTLSGSVFYSTMAYIEYLREKDQRDQIIHESGKKYWIIAFCNYENLEGIAKTEWFMGTETLYHELKVGETLCGFGYYEDNEVDNLDTFLFSTGVIRWIHPTLGLGQDGQEAVVGVEFHSTTQMTTLSKTVKEYRSIRLYQ